ncbi:MaoC family dehydratase [Glaciimonas sp. CA11.2]|uniref:MaoC family dehydratase n=1 Tax=unclassified Glaciimonas TaxID=2644401 RepID=UPI002AB4ACB8|nr:MULTISPECIES: MaoC family dehydratase [unclassified Glaciimonas]MDY7548008.1 MaoC family dehydratase [Glaciimonas sp. CA11.2]MEB0010178.1 MaoC family dehydratase [Glaciimonas sp. Cout2]MEB0084317.1 MaoC family dehydratase [Glaciimonas sp. Gout2]MEB0163166.1 MaoC family dehydratase [Glaciimonas sp. CA11.2]
MTYPSFEALAVGDAIPPFTTEPISRHTLALYAGASGDHNPIHVDLDFAKRAGMDDVFAHGMLSMAYLARLLTNWVPQTAIRSYEVRFVAVTQVAESVTCSGKVLEKFTHDGENRVRLELSTVSLDGAVKLTGEAVVSLS